MNGRNQLLKHLSWSLLAACLPTVLFFEVYTIFLVEVSHQATQIMPLLWHVYSGLIIFFLSLIAWTIHSLLGRLFFVGIAAFSLWSTKLAFLPEFSALGVYPQIAVVSLIALTILFVARQLDQKGVWPAFGLLLVLLAIFVITPLISNQVSEEGSTEHQISDTQSTHPGPAPVSTDFRIFESIQLKDKPNFYILLYDSLIPPELANLFFGSGSAGYQSELAEAFIRPSGVTLQNFVPSRESIRSVMWLDTAGAEGYEYFNGQKNGPLAHLFRANGYEVTTGYTTTFWGEDIGSYVNEYLYLASAPPELRQTTLCIDSGRGLLDRLRAFGVCEALGPFTVMPSAIKIWEQLTTQSKSKRKERPNEAWHKVVENHIRLSSYSDLPQLTFLYTYTPIGHTKSSYDHANVSDRADYVDHFKRFSALAGLVIADLVNVIQEVDPEAIVIVAGDHGTWIARNSDDKQFQLVDRHLVTLALLQTEHACVKKHQSDGFIPNKRGYHTVSSVALSLISCLAEDASIPSRLPTASLDTVPTGISLEEFIHRNISDELRTTFPAD